MHPPSRRFRFRFGLRTLFLAVTLLAVLCAWLGREVARARVQRKVAEEIALAGGSVMYEFRFDAGWRHITGQPSSGWRKILGEDLFSQINGVSMDRPDDAKLAVLAAPLKRLPHLESLNFTQARALTDRGFANLAKPRTLKRLQCYYASGLTGASLASLANCTEMEILLFAGARIEDEDLLHLRSMTKLRVLDFGKTPLSDAGLATLADLLELTSLSLSNTSVTDAGLPQLVKLSRLEQLHLEQTNITDRSIPVLAELKELKVLSIQATRITDAGAATLRAKLPGTKVRHKRPTKFDANGMPLDGDE
jgi:hypothetical protein